MKSTTLIQVLELLARKPLKPADDMDYEGYAGAEGTLYVSYVADHSIIADVNEETDGTVLQVYDAGGNMVYTADISGNVCGHPDFEEE